MSAQGVVARDSQKDLIAVLESGQLAEGHAQQAKDILDRMQKPLRLSILGLPGSGKSKLMNLLLGAQVFPEGATLPTISMTYAEVDSARCTLSNGNVETMDTSDLTQIAAIRPAFVELGMPLPALRKLSMMEVVVGHDPAEQQRAVRWAAKRTDIVLWCTQGCTPAEEQLWSLLPGNVQDHSFLILTKADALGAVGRLNGLVEDANRVGTDYFRQVLPVATTVALDARKPDGNVDKAALKSSGGMALISAILREVDAGQRAAADAAEVLLSQLDIDLDALGTEDTAEEFAVEETSASSEQPEAAPVQAEPAKEMAAPKVEAPTVSEEPVDKVEPETPETGLTPDARELCSQVVDQLTAEGEALFEQMEAGELTDDAVIDVSVDTVIWLADYLGDADVAGEPAMRRTCATANDAADLIQLIQLEKGDSVALDALSLMIQIKHEIQAELAA